MKSPFPMHWLFGAVSAMALAAMLAVALSGCGKKAEAPAAAQTANTPPTSLPTPAGEQAAKRDADARRQQFFGDGKSHYTPQDVHGF